MQFIQNGKELALQEQFVNELFWDDDEAFSDNSLIQLDEGKCMHLFLTAKMN